MPDVSGTSLTFPPRALQRRLTSPQALLKWPAGHLVEPRIIAGAIEVPSAGRWLRHNRFFPVAGSTRRCASAGRARQQFRLLGRWIEQVLERLFSHASRGIWHHANIQTWRRASLHALKGMEGCAKDL